MPKFMAQIDANKIPVKGLVPESSPTAPSSPVEGQQWYDSTNKKTMAYQNGAWVDLSSTGGASGTAGGDLTGTYPNPTIGANKVTQSKIAGDLVQSGLSQGGVTGTALPGAAALRALGNGASDAMAGNTALNQIPLPTSDVNFDGKKLIGLAAPTVSGDAATKDYVDGLIQGIKGKTSVLAATTASISGGAAPAGTQTIDGVATTTGQRILVKNQALPQNNGIYITNSGGSWSRAADADSWSELVGAFVFVETGSTQADTGWLCVADAGGTVGTTNLPWVQFSSAGTITASNGLNKVGNDIQIAALGIINSMIADGTIDLLNKTTGTLPVNRGGTGATGTKQARVSLAATHWNWYNNPAMTAGTWTDIPGTGTDFNGANTGVTCSVYDSTTREQVVVDVKVDSSTGVIALRADVAIAANALRIFITGSEV